MSVLPDRYSQDFCGNRFRVKNYGLKHCFDLGPLYSKQTMCISIEGAW